MKNFFTILGGMGTLASESFVRVLNERTVAKTDQEYLNYVLVNHATIPDRTAYIIGDSSDNPAEALIEDLKQQDLLKPNFYVLTCNTAHTFYDELTEVTTTPIFHMPRLAVQNVITNYPSTNKDAPIRVCLLATLGTVNSGVYSEEFSENSDYELVLPNEDIQEAVMNLIYRDIKEKQFLNETLFKEILDRVVTEMNCHVAILGCTELSLMNEVTNHQYPVVDAQSVLIDETILAARKKATI